MWHQPRRALRRARFGSCRTAAADFGVRMLQPATVEPSGRAVEHGTPSLAALERDLRERAGRHHPRVRLCNASARQANREVLPRAQVGCAHAEPQPAHGSGPSEVPGVPGRAGRKSSVAIPQGMSAELIGVFTEGVPLTDRLVAHGGRHGDSSGPLGTTSARRLRSSHGRARAPSIATRRLDRRLRPIPFAGVVRRDPTSGSGD